MITRRTAEFPGLESDPSRVPLTKTLETRKGKKEVFRATKGTPYYEDSHMQTPKTLKGRGARYAEFYDAADEAELGGDDSDDGRDYRDGAEDSAKDVIWRLSLDDAERDRGQYLEVRSHASLDKIAEFEGKRYRSDDSLQWLKRFIYEMKGARMPQDSWCEPFSLCLGRAAKGWYRQLPKKTPFSLCLGRAAKSWYRQLPKKTQRRWNLLSEAFLDYYYPHFDQSARTRYYSARRKENEPTCDFLLQLNGYTRTAKIQYGKGGADAFDHVEHFLLNCGDDDIMDLLYPMRLDDIKRVEKIINTKILDAKRKQQRGRLSGSRSRDGRRVESHRRPEATRLNESRKSDRRDDRREYRRDDWRTRREDGRDRRVTVAVTSDDEEADKVGCQPSRRLGQLDYDDGDSDYGREDYLDSEEESDHDYIDAGLANEKSRSGNSREDSARPQRNSARTQWNSTGPQGNSARQQPNSASHWNPVNPPPDRHSRVGRSSDRHDNYGRRGDSRERPQYGPCAACGGQGHSVHFCRKRCKFCSKCATWAGVSFSNVTNDWPTLLPRTSINPSYPPTFKTSIRRAI
ncbi:unnamed protein product [Phytophthora fragariaefolia]|uniref:Unnamed protein product n=1 Tax=Phytophthora fragariaefolia TaxID=1490495 RepID=A0A9W7D427_9STRA|nr:unnamed protein product [Phytophthora fragariaefolia]